LVASVAATILIGARSTGRDDGANIGIIEGFNLRKAPKSSPPTTTAARRAGTSRRKEMEEGENHPAVLSERAELEQWE
jgi:hypothetical protein